MAKKEKMRIKITKNEILRIDKNTNVHFKVGEDTVPTKYAEAAIKAEIATEVKQTAKDK